jgi:ABC-2 type transport system permease protein
MLDSLLRILALTRKELLAILKDPKSRFTIFIPPILQCLIYGYVATYDLTDVPFAVYDQDRSDSSRDLLSRLDGSGIFRRVANLSRAEDIKTFINDRRALLVIQINQNFERLLLMGKTADVQVIADGRNSNTAGTAMSYVSTIVEGFNADWRKAHPVNIAVKGSAGTATGSPTVDPGTLVQVSVRAWYNPNLETRWNMIPALIATLTMIQTLLLTAMSVAREREQGTFDQLLVTPFRPGEIMAGKALPSMLVGVIQATTVLLVAQLWFRIPFVGSFVMLYAGLILFLLAAVGIGLVVSSVSATMQQAMLYGFVVMIPFVLLSGLTTPISSMPEPIQYFTLINPLRYAIEMVHRVYLEGAGLALLMSDLWPLAVMAVVTLSAASWMFRHGLE